VVRTRQNYKDLVARPNRGHLTIEQAVHGRSDGAAVVELILLGRPGEATVSLTLRVAHPWA